MCLMFAMPMLSKNNILITNIFQAFYTLVYVFMHVKNKHVCSYMYCIVGNFQGRKLSQIRRK